MHSASYGRGGAQGSMGGGSRGSGGQNLPRAKRNEEKAKVSVWIDLENCIIPQGKNRCELSCCIISALKQLGYGGPVSMFAYGDINLFDKDDKIALQHSGVTFVHVHNTGPNAANRNMLVDLTIWAFDNPVPSSLLIISDDTNFWPTMKDLKDKGHNVMMACPPRTYTKRPPVDTILSWEELVEGKLSPAQIQ